MDQRDAWMMHSLYEYTIATKVKWETSRRNRPFFFLCRNRKTMNKPTHITIITATAAYPAVHFFSGMSSAGQRGEKSSCHVLTTMNSTESRFMLTHLCLLLNAKCLKVIIWTRSDFTPLQSIRYYQTDMAWMTSRCLPSDSPINA